MGKVFWSESFTYNEELFYRYFALHLRPHEKRMGHDLLQHSVVYLLFSLPVLWVEVAGIRSAGTGGAMGWLSSHPVFIVGVVLFLVGIFGTVEGVRAFLGISPSTSSAHWRERAALSLAWASANPDKSPYDPNIEIRPQWVVPIAWRAGATHWYDDYLVPRRLEASGEPGASPSEVHMSVLVCEDGVRRGPNHVLCPWSEMYDLLEDCGDAGIAILRSKKQGEILLLKDGFDAPWISVKKYILSAIRRNRPAERPFDGLRKVGEVLTGKRNIGEEDQR